jgi:ribosome maturation factor RimP
LHRQRLPRGPEKPISLVVLDIGNFAEAGAPGCRRDETHVECAWRMADMAALTKLIEPEAEALGLALVRVQMFGGTSDPTLQVMAERPDTRQLDLSDCEALSRRISEVLDHADPIETAYRLEVSSPGIDRPLTRRQDFEDWKGHEVRIRLAHALDGRKQFDGTLHGLVGEHVLLHPDKGHEVSIPYASIASAKLKLTDALIKATAPLSPEGADIIKQEG